MHRPTGATLLRMLCPIKRTVGATANAWSSNRADFGRNAPAPRWCCTSRARRCALVCAGQKPHFVCGAVQTFPRASRILRTNTALNGAVRGRAVVDLQTSVPAESKRMKRLEDRFRRAEESGTAAPPEYPTMRGQDLQIGDIQ